MQAGRKGNAFAPVAPTWQPTWSSSPPDAATSQFSRPAVSSASGAVGIGDSPATASFAAKTADKQPCADASTGWHWPAFAGLGASSTSPFGSPASMGAGSPGSTPAAAAAKDSEQGTPAGSVFSNPLFGAAASPPSTGAAAGSGAGPAAARPPVVNSPPAPVSPMSQSGRPGRRGSRTDGPASCSRRLPLCNPGEAGTEAFGGSACLVATLGVQRELWSPSQGSGRIQLARCAAKVPLCGPCRRLCHAAAQRRQPDIHLRLQPKPGLASIFQRQEVSYRL